LVWALSKSVDRWITSDFLKSAARYIASRSLNQFDNRPVGIAPMERSTIQGLAAMPKMTEASATEWFDRSAEQAVASGDLGDRPLIVLTAGKPTPSRSETVAEAQQDQKIWIQLQSQLTRLSTRGHQVIVKNSSHMIPFEAPKSIVQAVLEVLSDTGRDARRHCGQEWRCGVEDARRTCVFSNC
jgi:hypothetical protein